MYKQHKLSQFFSNTTRKLLVSRELSGRKLQRWHSDAVLQIWGFLVSWPLHYMQEGSALNMRWCSDFSQQTAQPQNEMFQICLCLYMWQDFHQEIAENTEVICSIGARKMEWAHWSLACNNLGPLQMLAMLNCRKTVLMCENHHKHINNIGLKQTCFIFHVLRVDSSLDGENWILEKFCQARFWHLKRPMVTSRHGRSWLEEVIFNPGFCRPCMQLLWHM